MVKPHTSVFLKNIKADETMAIVRELRKLGLEQGINFDFKYHRGNYFGNNEQASGAEFYFYQGKWATFFAIKYAA